MKCVTAHIVLLLCLSGVWAQGEMAIETTETTGHQTDRQTASIAPDIWTELKDLRDMVHVLGATVVEQKVELRYVEARLTESESKVEQLEMDKAALEARLTTSEMEMADQKNEVMALRVDLDVQKKKVEDLEREIAGTPKVAFSACSTVGGIGPFNTETPLIYSLVHVNTGSGYNKNTGVFTAPVRGVYYFRFTAYDYRTSRQYTGVNLYRNDQKLMYNYEYNDDGGDVSVSNAIIVEMSQGDVVYLRLPSGFGMYSSTNNESTFSGFLLFPL